MPSSQTVAHDSLDPADSSPELAAFAVTPKSRCNHRGTALVVDDSGVARRYLQSVLLTTGVCRAVETASTADDATRILEEQGVDLVVCDLDMPGRDGLDFLEMSRATLSAGAIPVIMITSEDEVQSKVRCLEAGASDYLVKPFADEELVARAKAQLQLKALSDELRAKNAQLERANRKLKKVSDRKSDFISTVSHELRTPLTAIQNSLSLVAGGKAGPLTEKQNQFMKMASRNAARLGVIIGDLLDLSKIEAGKLAFRFQEVDLGALLETTGRDIDAAGTGAAELRLDIPSGLPTIWADPNRVEQVVVNLLSNAFKFTDARGSVTLRAVPVADGVQVLVADTGVGLAPEERDRIFDRFYQVQDPLTRSVQGSGLGLSIVRRLLAVHGTSIEVESELGEGSTFSFTLPAFTPEAAEMSDFEEVFEECRGQAYVFSLLTVRPPEGERSPEALERLQRRVRSCLPRVTDLIVRQEANGRLLIVLLNTPGEGASVVRRRLHGVFLERAGHAGEVAEIFGPACFPKDGSSGKQLLISLENSP